MLDRISLDQLRTFIAAAEAGSFSAAGRRIGRAQSVVSQTLSNLEAQLGVRLFDRTSRYPVITEQGRALLEDARQVAERMDLFKARARGLSAGLEAELSVVINVLFPTAILTDALKAFQARFPETALRVSVEGLGAVIDLVLGGTCAFGIRGPLALSRPELNAAHLLNIDYVMVAAPSHPLAQIEGPIPARMVTHHVQLVLADRSTLTQGQDLRVYSGKTWRLFDLGAKHAFLRAGLGWGGMPLHIVADDLRTGALVRLNIAEIEQASSISMSAIWRTDTPPGPAGQGLIEELTLASARAGPVD